MKYAPFLILLLVACAQPMEHDMSIDKPMNHMADMHSVSSEEQFIVNMIPHHQEAVDTAETVLESEDEELRELAGNIITAQEEEIEMMNSWLDEWYPEHMEETYEEMMPDLLSLEGSERDKAFIEGMIEHHEGAVIMAEDVLKLEPREEVKKFANAVIEVQTSEINQMKAMLERY